MEQEVDEFIGFHICYKIYQQYIIYDQKEYQWLKYIQNKANHVMTCHDNIFFV